MSLQAVSSYQARTNYNRDGRLSGLYKPGVDEITKFLGVLDVFSLVGSCRRMYGVVQVSSFSFEGRHIQYLFDALPEDVEMNDDGVFDFSSKKERMAKRLTKIFERFKAINLELNFSDLPIELRKIWEVVPSKKLVKLSAEHQLGDITPRRIFKRFPCLQDVYFHSIPVFSQTEDLSPLAKLPLTSLYFSCSGIDDEALVHVPTTLKALAVDGDHQLTDKGLELLACRMAKLTKLTLLYDENFTAAGFRSLAKIRTLQALRLESVYGVRKEHWAQIAMLPSLDTLEISGSELDEDGTKRLQGDDLTVLKDSKTLKHLILEERVMVTDLRGINSLEVLSLEDDHPNIFNNTLQLPAFLKELNISSRTRAVSSDNLTRLIRQTPVLTHLRVKRCNLHTGQIRGIMEDCASLQFFEVEDTEGKTQRFYRHGHVSKAKVGYSWYKAFYTLESERRR